MNLSPKYLGLILLISFAIPVAAQTQTVLQNLHNSIKWYQIKTPHFKIIYPAGFGEQGQRMANTMEHIYSPVSASLGVEPKKNFPLILQNQNSISNGFVTLGPRRSEFYTMSPQRASLVGNNDWLEMLALHEYRHVVQYDKSRTGLTGFIRNIFGEYSQAAVASATVPSWFWEGDAVGVETAFSESGRGRIPEFSAAFRANFLELGPFSYNKQYLRSYKDFIPDHYVLGYHYSTYLKNEYGLEAVEKMVNRTWGQPYIPFGFSFAQKKYGADKMPKTYLAMAEQLTRKWQNELSQLTITPYTKVNTMPKKVYTNYDNPQILDNGNLLVFKSGLGNYGQFVEINRESGSEEIVFTPGVVNQTEMLSARGAIVVWNEFEFDPRWRQRTYSVIRTYNIASKQYTALTKNTRYSSAAISPDRSKIVTVEELQDYNNRIVILDAYSGKILDTYQPTVPAAISSPTWSDDESIVYAEVLNHRKEIKEFNLISRAEATLLPPTNEQISDVLKSDNWLYYVSGVSGIDNIYAKNLSLDKIYQVTTSKYGAYNPVIGNDGYIYYNELTVLGNDVAKIKLAPQEWVPLDNEAVTYPGFYAPMAKMEDQAHILNTIPEVRYDSSRYRKKILNLHSWGPYLSDQVNELEAGLYSTNVLSTTDLFLGFTVDTQANFKWIGRVSYQGLYPIIDVEMNYAHRNTTLSYRDSVITLPDSIYAIRNDYITWNETGVKAGLRIPWVLTHNKFYVNLTLQNYLGVTAVKDYQSSAFGDDKYYLYFSTLGNGNLLNNEFRISFSSLHKQSKRDIQSKFGFVLVMENFSTPYGGDFQAGLTALRSQLYLPGVFKHHSLNFFAGYQHNNITLDNNNYWFANRMPYPRGVSGSTFEDFYTLRVNYDLPLLYPDLSVGPWLYIQRVKAKLFYDYGYGKSDVFNKEQSLQLVSSKYYYSTGAELSFNFNFMRALPLLDLGVRFSYLPDLGQTQFEFLVGSFGL